MARARARQPCLASEHYSLADAGFTPCFVRLDRLGMREVVERHPSIAGWYQRRRARPAFQTAITAHDVPERMAILIEGGTATWKILRDKVYQFEEKRI